MPRQVVKELTALQVNKIAPPGYHRVGGVSGLCLQVKASGARSWVLRLTFGGRRQDVGLGGYPTVTLAMARERARRVLDEAWAGRDPRLPERKAALAAAAQEGAAAAAMTFSEAWLAFRKDRVAAEKKSPDEARILEARLTKYAFDVLGKVKLPEVTTAHILEVLNPIWTTKNDTAVRLRAGIEEILNWAIFHGHRTGDNPARWKGHLDQVLASPSKVKRAGNHQPALPVDDLPAFFAALRGRDTRSARALEFLILTAVRSGEATGARWSEIDMDAGVWTIPADRMKAEREHRIPLPSAAMELLASMPRMAGTDIIFPGQNLRDEMSDATMRKVVRLMHEAEVKAGRDGWTDRISGRVAVPHGFRSTFRDWSAERGHDRDMTELALAHQVGSAVERAYRRTDMLERRRGLLADWADYALSGLAESLPAPRR